MAGLLLLPVGVVAIETLYRQVHAGPLHDATAWEVLLATGSFVCLSLGSAFLALGAQIFDEVEVSARWASRYGSPPAAALDARSMWRH